MGHLNTKQKKIRMSKNCLMTTVTMEITTMAIIAKWKSQMRSTGTCYRFKKGVEIRLVGEVYRGSTVSATPWKVQGHGGTALHKPAETGVRSLGFLGGTSGKELTGQCSRHKRCGFDPWIGKTPWGRTWQHPPVFLPGEPDGQRSLESYGPWGHKEWDTTGVP